MMTCKLPGVHIGSPTLLKLHEIHNALIVTVYKLLLARTRRQSHSQEIP